ncbi:hypothetical protein H7X46_24190 [Pseudonocardia sp. C8]|uniref:hypothetical protein n=1 Tax=Pseudonocardia sp. C8 TaxID=2762759 RepID=UPI00164277C5|nr:hypothetical protein [Pseudonocardia sp. C8]MBC3194157.1 hypothetical protein [Pseudonocardia sp. C8]
MNTSTKTRPRVTTGVGRLVRRLEIERRRWTRHEHPVVPTERAWRAGVAEGLRLAQIAIRKGV